ncbi:helix-turn-helix transcriptional regulator [Streptomyces sp. NPDC051322]|uniref:helix-turn-helix domain-containing protein n=1 Tax=Streptomyces sp. NPDC051322 TaxID=3154645 RepID=UPI00344DC0C0
MAVGSETEEFAALLRRLKDRSGRSYGVLAGKLHMSTSTVHRYCNGDAVPTEYAPVERFARLCAATPDELVELHRRWILADAARRRPKGAVAAEKVIPDEVVPEVVPVVAPEPEPVSPAAATAARTARWTRRRQPWLIGAAVAASVAVAVPVAVALTQSGTSHPSGTSTVAGGPGEIPLPPSSSAPAELSKRPTGSPTPSRSASPSASASHSRAPSGALGADGDSVPAVPLSVDVRPYVWDGPCSQSYLVDRKPDRVPPPETEQDAANWARALGAVSSGGARIELSVQGKTTDAVVLQALHVRIVGRHAPLDWASFAMGDGCGGGLVPAAFDIDLDAGMPMARAKAGVQGDRKIPATDFPYRVSTTDPQVLEVNAHTAGHDVSWYLELRWSSGDRHGTLRIDDHGKPFRASAPGNGQPHYVYPLGGDGWEPAVEQGD